MKISLAAQQLEKLAMLGQAIDVGHLTEVFDGGRVEVLELNGKEVNDNEQRQRTGGPATGTRQGSQGAWRASGESGTVGIGSEEVVQLAELDSLRQAYPSQIIQGDYGLWVIVKAKPLGDDGPQVTFVIALPHDRRIDVKSWGFWKLGEFPKPIGPRHTNFPDQSICAFVPDDQTWTRDMGILALVDLYSTWVIRQLFFQNFGRWPGDQIGASALYRRLEFSNDEWCGCGSGEKYGECHAKSDRSMTDAEAEAEHLSVFKLPYVRRKVPISIQRFVRSGFAKIPTFQLAYQGR